MNEDVVTVILGDEFDDKLRTVLRKVLMKNNAVVTHKSWGIGGSQELDFITIILNGEKITIESETYVGLTITGSKMIIEELGRQVTELMGSRGGSRGQRP